MNSISSPNQASPALAASAMELASHTFPTWDQAQHAIDIRAQARDPLLAEVRQRLHILSQLTDEFPPVDLLEPTLKKVFLRDPDTIRKLELVYSTTRELAWAHSLSVCHEKELTAKAQFPSSPSPVRIEANFFIPNAAHTYARSELSVELLENLVVRKHAEREPLYWRFTYCPDLSVSVPLWFQRIGESLRPEIFERALDYLDKTPSDAEVIHLNVIGRAIYFAIEDIRLEHQREEQRHMLLVINFMRLCSSLSPGERPSYKESEDDVRPPAQDLYQLNEIQRAAHCIHAERVASDHIRATVIPRLLQEAAPSSQSYWEIHRNRFGSTPASVQNFGNHPFVLSEYTQRASRGDFYDNNIGKLRTIEVSGDGVFVHLPCKHLPQLSQQFFGVLDEILRTPPNDLNQKLDTLAYTRAFLSLAHFPFDGAGRTNEDFIVYLAKRMGVDLSLSTSGYRHHLSPLVREFVKIETQFKHEYELATLQDLGVVPSTFDEDLWLENITQLMDRIAIFGAKGFQVEKSLRSLVFINALQGDEEQRAIIGRRFPSITAMKDLFLSACGETYSYMEPEPGLALDLFMAKSFVTAPWQFRKELIQKRGSFSEDPISQAFLTEHLQHRELRFVSEKLIRNYRELRKRLHDL